MTILPVCSATSSCSHSLTSFHGGLQSFSPFRKDFELKCNVEDGIDLGLKNGTHLQRVCFKTQATKSLYSSFVENSKSVSIDFINSCPNELDDISCKPSNAWSYSVEAANEMNPMGSGELKYIEDSSVPAVEEGLVDFADRMTENADKLMAPVEPKATLTIELTPENPTTTFDSLDMDNSSISNIKSSFDDFLAGVNESFSSSMIKGENAVKSSLDTITSSLTSIKKSTSEAVDNVVSRVFSSIDQTGGSAGSKLTNFSTDLKEASSKATVAAVDVLRNTIVALEESITNGASFVVYYYGTTKESLAPEIRDALNLYEDRAVKLWRPVGSALQQVSVAIEGLERSLGFDPNDPIVPFVVFLGTSATLWIFYWWWTYGGYSGDLSPKSTLELLRGKENAVLIDVRHEDLRERDGIPDLRRGARFRYASVYLPEVGGSVKKLLRGGRELDDTLTAAIIRNLKIVQDRSKVIVMDADGTRSKGIARSLRKLGVMRPFLVQGGFQSWVKEGLRIKELKSETALTILNEDAEAILEDINPSPVQFLGFGVGCFAVLYALLEWEKTLQFIGVIGLGQTIYRRVASYNDAEDFKQDVRMLLAPVRIGAQAFSWAAGKLETNRPGLPTSPSSVDVQNRVLQAAAKHESQPADTEGIQDPSSESVASMNDNVDLSEA
ncbi:calcium sensing receptor, chloroplastic [Citrus clementina]|uniref:calcium sensing receptor, chloroplastic n=1 Tax=Citrus clementina TaxID=85681 RepID=UPI000CED3922|nr:calcium sensing receptor, chloroplastic [Citrus x clementina]